MQSFFVRISLTADAVLYHNLHVFALNVTFCRQFCLFEMTLSVRNVEIIIIGMISVVRTDNSQFKQSVNLLFWYKIFSVFEMKILSLNRQYEQTILT